MEKKIVPIVLCAGLGTRLRPLTHHVPKTAAPLGDMPIALNSIKQLLDFGFEQVHCNSFYIAEFVEKEIHGAARYHGIDPKRIRFWREEELLNTGGGIQRIWEGLCKEDPTKRSYDAFVVSGDIWSDIPLKQIFHTWETRSENSTALMATKDLHEARSDVTWVDLRNKRVRGFGADLKADSGFTSRLFSNHQMIGSELLKAAKIEKISSVEMYYRAALKRGGEIIDFEYSEDLPWFNIGTYGEYFDSMGRVRLSKKLNSPDHCVVISAKKGVMSTQKLIWKHPLPGSLNVLHTQPSLGDGVSFSKKLEEILKMVSGFPNHPTDQGESTHPQFQQCLVFTFAEPLLNLPSPLLVPLELLTSPDPRECFAAGSPYQSSQTFFLFR